MAYGKDWIPHSQDEFVPWSQQYVAGVGQLAAALGLDPARVTGLKAAQAAFMAAWGEYAVREKSPSVNAGKQALVDARRAAIRDFQNQNLRHNKALTNAMREACGLPLRAPRRNRIPAGSSHIAFTLESKGTGQVKIRCQEEETGEKRIAYGKSGILLHYAVGPAPATDFSLLTQSALITKTIHLFTFDPSRRSLWLTVSACWQSSTGEHGPWSVLQSAVIP